MIRKNIKTKKKPVKKVTSRRNPETSKRDIEKWMMDYMKTNPNYDPRPMAGKAIRYFGISVNDEYDNWVQELAFDLAEKFEYEKQRNIQRKASVKKRGFPLGLGNSPFKKQNPTLREITLPEIKKWMVRYMELNPNYDEPDDIAKHAIIHLNIQVTPQDRKDLIRFAYNVADEYEMNRKR